MIKVKDIMVPLEDYSTINQDATLSEAVAVMKKSRDNPVMYPHRAILVVDSYGHVLGKVSQFDVLKSLEPTYDKISTGSESAGKVGFSSKFLKQMADDFRLWDEPLDQIAKKAHDIHVKEIMYAPASEGEYVHEETSLNDAIHQIIMGQHQSLLVIRRGKITGILRLTEIFEKISELMSEIKNQD